MPGLRLLLLASMMALTPQSHPCGLIRLHATLTSASRLQVAYIDTEGTFRPERIAPIAARYNLDLPSVLDNVRCAECMPLLCSLWLPACALQLTLSGAA